MSGSGLGRVVFLWNGEGGQYGTGCASCWVQPLTVRSPRASSAIGAIPSIGHGDLMFLVDMAPPHALCVDASIGAATKCTAQTGQLLVSWPFIWALSSGFFLTDGAPASGRFQG